MMRKLVTTEYEEPDISELMQLEPCSFGIGGRFCIVFNPPLIRKESQDCISVSKSRNKFSSKIKGF